MKIINTHIPDVIIFEPACFNDERGYFLESFQYDRYSQQGITQHFVQDNVSRSSHGVLRGLHYQLPHAQGKLVSVIRGKVLDVAVDIRQNSPTFAQVVSVILDDNTHRQMYIPPGFAHGFCVLSPVADFHYKCSANYHAAAEQGLRWDCPDLAIKWPNIPLIISAKDRNHPTLAQIAPHNLPRYEDIL